MIALPQGAVLWGNALDLSACPQVSRDHAGRAAAAYLARAAECGCDVHWTNDLDWLQTLHVKTDLPHLWAPMRAQHWPNFRNTTSILVLTPAGSRQAVATICVRRLWVEGPLDSWLLAAFGTYSYNEILSFGGDLAADVADCHVAWACGLWRADQLRGQRIGRDLVSMAAIDALARWHWSWFMGLRRDQAHERLGLAPFDRLEAPVLLEEGKKMLACLMLVSARRARIRHIQAETAGAA
ncbi:MAG: hypothetical protein O9320_08730 [Magnetospirillum sp.]|nr:hypothetical protein [Magnetospirillum sp.]